MPNAFIKDGMTREELFWSRLVRTEYGCWEWPGRRTKAGYGGVSYYKRMMGAHRLAWMLTNGPIPKGMCVCHTCDNPPCCNPDHLWLGTYKENVADCIRKGRRIPQAKRAHGEMYRQAKLSYAKVAEIRQRHAVGDVSMHQLAREYNVSYPTIYHTVKGRYWKTGYLERAA